MISVYRFCLLALCGLMLSTFVIVPQTQAAILQTSSSFSCSRNYFTGLRCTGALGNGGYNTSVRSGQTISITVTRLESSALGIASFGIRSGGNDLAFFSMTEEEGTPRTFRWTNNTGTTQSVNIEGNVWGLCGLCYFTSSSVEGVITVQ